MLWIRCPLAVLAVAVCGNAAGQASIISSYENCVSDSAAFAKDARLNEVVTEYLANFQREIDSSLYQSRVAGMAGLEDRANQARLRADQYRQELQRACAHISQSLNETDQRPKADPIVPAETGQSAERQRQALVEQELNQRVPGAIFLMNEAGFAQWLDGRQGTMPRRDAWNRAILTDDFEQAVQLLREYERGRKSK